MAQPQIKMCSILPMQRTCCERRQSVGHVRVAPYGITLLRNGGTAGTRVSSRHKERGERESGQEGEREETEGTYIMHPSGGQARRTDHLVLELPGHLADTPVLSFSFLHNQSRATHEIGG